MMELKWYKGVSKGVAPHGTQDPSSSISSLTQGLSPKIPHQHPRTTSVYKRETCFPCRKGELDSQTTSQSKLPC